MNVLRITRGAVLFYLTYIICSQQTNAPSSGSTSRCLDFITSNAAVAPDSGLVPRTKHSASTPHLSLTKTVGSRSTDRSRQVAAKALLVLIKSGNSMRQPHALVPTRAEAMASPGKLRRSYYSQAPYGLDMDSTTRKHRDVKSTELESVGPTHPSTRGIEPRWPWEIYRP